MQTAEGRADVLEEQRDGQRNEEVLSTVGGVLSGIFGGRRSRGGVFGQLGRAAGRRGRTSATDERLDVAQDKVNSLSEQLVQLQGELEDEVAAIDVRWSDAGKAITTEWIPLEKADVKVTQLLLVWLPTT